MSDTRKVGTFPHFDEKYKCCCRTIHVEQGARLIIFTGFIMTILAVFLAVLGIDPVMSRLHWFLIFCEFIGILVAIVGMRKKSAKYLLPYLFLNCVSILNSLFMFIAHHVIRNNPDSTLSAVLKATVDHPGNEKLRDLHKEIKEGGSDTSSHEVAMSIVDTLHLMQWFLEIFFFYVCYKYYVYMRDLERYYETLHNENDVEKAIPTE